MVPREVLQPLYCKILSINIHFTLLSNKFNFWIFLQAVNEGSYITGSTNLQYVQMQSTFLVLYRLGGIIFFCFPR
jgi:hypothetical protein